MFGRRIGDRRTGRTRLGQVVVEMLLILPVFLTIVFTIMEMGHMAFWVIVLNHATYEVARIGALRATGNDGGEPKDVTMIMNTLMNGIIHSARVTAVSEKSFHDRQADQDNNDLVVTGKYDVRMVFPLSSVLLSSRLCCPQGPGGGKCTISATIRMPIERPLHR